MTHESQGFGVVMSGETLFDLDHPRETRVTVEQADTNEHVHIHPDRDPYQGGPTDRIWITNLGQRVELMWSQRWDAGGYAIRVPLALARAIAEAVDAYEPTVSEEESND